MSPMEIAGTARIMTLKRGCAAPWVRLVYSRTKNKMEGGTSRHGGELQSVDHGLRGRTSSRDDRSDALA